MIDIDYWLHGKWGTIKKVGVNVFLDFGKTKIKLHQPIDEVFSIRRIEITLDFWPLFLALLRQRLFMILPLWIRNIILKRIKIK